jgi:hypothetical protein
MKKLQSGPPSSTPRPARRSLVEFSLPANETSDERGAVLINGLPDSPHALAASSDRPGQDNASSMDKGSSSITTVPVDANAYEMMMTNVGTAMEYARRFSRVRTPTEFVELSMSHGSWQLNFLMKQAVVVGSIVNMFSAVGAKEPSE